jgi:hypothetical protein
MHLVNLTHSLIALDTFFIFDDSEHGGRQDPTAAECSDRASLWSTTCDLNATAHFHVIAKRAVQSQPFATLSFLTAIGRYGTYSRV